MSEAETQDVLEVLEPSSQIYKVEIAGEEFYQTPLTFFGKIELFSVLADAIDKALAEGALVSEFLEDLPESTGDLKDADIFIKAIAKVVRFAPDILSDIFSISLNVPRNRRDDFKDFLLPTITDEQGMEILNHFVDQNWDAMMDFFSKQAMPLINKVSEKAQSRSASSTPSKGSRRRTAKA